MTLAPPLRAALLALLLTGCAALPRSAPLSSDIEGAAADGTRAARSLVATLTPEIAALVSPAREAAIPRAFLRAAEIDPERIGVGDELELRIWEPVESPLFRAESGAAALLLKVDRNGRVHLPFAGKVRARGASLETLRARIETALAPYLADPEIDLRQVTTPSRMVTLQGAVSRPGAYPIQSFAARITPMLALAGGASAPAETLELALRRGDKTARAPLTAVLEQPALDLALRPGDTILLAPVRRRFTAIGAVTSQQLVRFPGAELTLIDALGLVRGLRDFDADPSAVYLFRREDPALAARILEGPAPQALGLEGGRPVIYRLDLDRPESLFAAQRFAMRDGDALVASNAPLTELRKIVSLFSGVTTQIRATTALVQ